MKNKFIKNEKEYNRFEIKKNEILKKKMKKVFKKIEMWNKNKNYENEKNKELRKWEQNKDLQKNWKIKKINLKN